MTKTFKRKYICGIFSHFTYYNNNVYEDVSDHKLFDKFFLESNWKIKKSQI